MRRAKPLSVRVKAPSRGIISRWPGQTADKFVSGSPLFNSLGMASRAAAAGSNVRYEDGVVCAAPGYDRVLISSSILVGLLSHWRFEELSGTRFDATLNHRDLTEVDGTGPIIPPSLSGSLIVGQVSGQINFAASFPSVELPIEIEDEISLDTQMADSSVYGCVQRHTGEVMDLDTTLSFGFIDHIIKHISDSSALDTSLSGGVFFEAATTAAAISDEVSSDVRLNGGTHSEVVVSDYEVDSVFADVQLGSGSFALTVVISDDLDELSADVRLESGTYADVLFGPEADSDELSLTMSLNFGSYD